MRREALARAFETAAAGYAFAGLGCGGSRPTELAWHAAPGITADEHSLFRVASNSKIVTGQIFAEAAARWGKTPPYGRPVREVLPWFPGNATLGQLASHTGGVSDTAGYVVPPGDTLAEFIIDRAKGVFSGTLGRFDYSNLGYIVLAAAIETWTDRRFDLLAQDWLAARGIPGGFNWSGVTDRTRTLPTYRRGADGFVPQIDQALDPAGVLGPDGRALDLTDYRPGNNPALFSPQGGLRTSLRGLLTLAEHLPEMDTTVLHLGAPYRGDLRDADAVFESYGLGLQVFDAPAFYSHPLIGHFANAYGFRGGVWYDRARDIAFAYALNGLDEGDESDAFCEAELRIFETVAEWEG